MSHYLDWVGTCWVFYKYIIFQVIHCVLGLGFWILAQLVQGLQRSDCKGFYPSRSRGYSNWSGCRLEESLCANATLRPYAALDSRLYSMIVCHYCLQDDAIFNTAIYHVIVHEFFCAIHTQIQRTFPRRFDIRSQKVDRILGTFGIKVREVFSILVHHEEEIVLAISA